MPEFSQTPFERIGFCLSGGGYRAAAYGLGVLSLMNEITVPSLTEDNTTAEPLLRKVDFIASASGGTIPLTMYAAAIRKGIPFNEFFRNLNNKLTGEAILQLAVNILDDDQRWEGCTKTRNPINAFALAYHESLFDFLDAGERDLGFIMNENHSPSTAHIGEFCFNASEFYTGLSFRFQGGTAWKPNAGGKFGNRNIAMDSDPLTWNEHGDTLKKIRLADILAASSCFPLGFEPIMFPKDFSYAGSASVKELEDAITLNAYSWDEQLSDAENMKSKRATKEKQFTDKKEFALMDGGICDNQGLDSMLLANGRKPFDLMMVSDVTSFYMNPYNEPALNTSKPWAQKTPMDYWKKARGLPRKVSRLISRGYIISIIIAIAFMAPLALDKGSLASIILAIVGLVPLAGMIFLQGRYKKLLKNNPKIAEALKQQSLQDVYRQFFPANTFNNRTAMLMIAYLQRTKLSILANMGLTRAMSAATMILEIFLKHIRRLIYSKLFSDPVFLYRRQENPIYRLTYSNRRNRRMPSFDEMGDENPQQYRQRRKLFYEEVTASLRLTDEMQEIAERAYNAGTTLWFTTEEESDTGKNVREAIIATGQFSTCYALLRYTLSLKHSRNFAALPQPAKDRINKMLEQFKAYMIAFEQDPFWLYKKLK